MAKGARDVHLAVWIVAPPAKVYRALTGGKELARWFVAKAESDARPGGRLALTWKGIGTGEYRFLKLVAGREVAFSWEKGCRIAFRLSHQRGGTFVRLTLHAVPYAGKELDCYTMMVSGWTMYLCNLKCVLERHWDLREDQPRGSCIA